ncbi:hypothetical protein [Chryseobacterium sp. MFBS3-17]|uniref:hypothetical protein n=1 Tax=Chryseobacterium sp. MFBS3-17 TaxID=2886689 RepID=UPI001D0F0EDA|nr:hypothetical protein [Chryseobacterium sp. MFBS3-17]MCC2591107.1 hypothetical protein [Chryseobacterium sp. MFBS3-17]
MQIFLQRVLCCFLAFFLTHSCASQETRKYFENEYNESYSKCLKIDDFNLLENKSKACKDINAFFFEFSDYTQKSLDSLNNIEETDFIIFNSVRGRDLRKCMFTYNTKTGNANSGHCDIFSDGLVKEVTNDWNNFQNNKESRFSKNDDDGKHWLYYVIYKKNSQAVIEKLYR